MKTVPLKPKARKSNQPFEVVKTGSISVPIYAHNNIIPRRDPQTRAICYETLPDGKRKALVKYQSVIYTVAYYQGTKRVRQKFSDLAKARREAQLITIKLANGETEALKLTGGDRADYIRAMQKLREWKPDIDLNFAVTDYVSAMRRLPENVSLREALEFYLKRHLIGLPPKTVREVVDELIAPKDHDEIGAVERATVDSGEIEVFSPAELQKLFAACLTPVKERGKWRTREEMIPYLAIAAFCGLRAAEIQRLDWSEIHLVGPERFVEIKAGNAKTASRRTVPINDNCAAWLERYAKPSGPIINLSRADKQLFLYLAEKSGVPWKHNGLRHSFISYRLALVKDVGQVSLEAGNSPQMVFKHYRQLVRESEAKEWFGIQPPKHAENVVPLQIAASA